MTSNSAQDDETSQPKNDVQSNDVLNDVPAATAAPRDPADEAHDEIPGIHASKIVAVGEILKAGRETVARKLERSELRTETLE